MHLGTCPQWVRLAELVLQLTDCLQWMHLHAMAARCYAQPCRASGHSAEQPTPIANVHYAHLAHASASTACSIFDGIAESFLGLTMLFTLSELLQAVPGLICVLHIMLCSCTS